MSANKRMTTRTQPTTLDTLWIGDEVNWDLLLDWEDFAGFDWDAFGDVDFDFDMEDMFDRDAWEVTTPGPNWRA